MIVTAIAVVLVGPALVLLYRLDTMGELEPLTDADTRGRPQSSVMWTTGAELTYLSQERASGTSSSPSTRRGRHRCDDGPGLIGVGLILVLAVGSQVLAGRLRIPALIVLLPVGFAAGALTDDVNPEQLLGRGVLTAGLAGRRGDPLRRRPRAGPGEAEGPHPPRRRPADLDRCPDHLAARRAARRAAAGHVPRAAVMLGAILVVSGPTVVGPLLGFVRPTDRLQRILIWEGSLIDPVGGILGALVFHAVVREHGRTTSAARSAQFLASVGIGVAGGAVGAALLWVLFRVLRLGEVLGTTAQLAAVVGVAAVCDVLRDDAGLIAAVVMGLAVANLPGFDVPARRPFFETLVSLIIGLLFISISATVTPHVAAPRGAAHARPGRRPGAGGQAAGRVRGHPRHRPDHAASGASSAGWRRAASSRPPPPRRSRPAWSPRASAARRRSFRPPSWSSSPPSRSTA